MTDADLFRAKIEWETDTAVTGTFKRDMHMTPVALFKERVLDALHDEAEVDSDSLRTRESVIWTLIRLIDGMPT
jgi:hypothetical protein